MKAVLGWLVLLGLILGFSAWGCGLPPDCKTMAGFPVYDNTGRLDCGAVDLGVVALVNTLGYGRRALEDGGLEVLFEDALPPPECTSASAAGCYYGYTGQAYVWLPGDGCVANSAFQHELLHHIFAYRDHDSDHDHVRPEWRGELAEAHAMSYAAEGG